MVTNKGKWEKKIKSKLLVTLLSCQTIFFLNVCWWLLIVISLLLKKYGKDHKFKSLG